MEKASTTINNRNVFVVVLKSPRRQIIGILPLLDKWDAWHRIYSYRIISAWCCRIRWTACMDLNHQEDDTRDCWNPYKSDSPLAVLLLSCPSTSFYRRWKSLFRLLTALLAQKSKFLSAPPWRLDGKQWISAPSWRASHSSRLFTPCLRKLELLRENLSN